MDEIKMNYSISEEKNKQGIGSKYFLYIVYVAFVFVLAYSIWPKYEATQFSAYHYVLDFHLGKLILGIGLALFLSYTVYKRFSTDISFSGRTILLLSMLYFIPGIAISCALNFDWGYLLAYLVYYYVMVLADRFIGKPRKAPIKVKEGQAKIIFWILIIVALLYPVVMASIYNRSFSIANFLLTFDDPYGMRAQAREKGISWAFLLIENWGVYFGALLITYSLKRKNTILAVAFILVEAFYFSLQGNRIYIFITGIAILLGIFKLKEEHLPHIFIGLLGVQILEFLLFHNLHNVGFVMNVFRRFSIVPNIISTKYYEFFLTEVPDFLRDYFPNISRLFGTSSPYGVNVGYTIGQQFFGMYLNANTGLVGGAFFEFGFLGVIIDPIMLVLSFRIFEKVLFSAENEITMITALIYASLAINSWSLWAQCIRISYVPLLIISIYIMVNREDYELSYRETKRKLRFKRGGAHGRSY